MKHLLLILNPVAGVKKAAKSLADIISVFNRADYDVHVYVTTQQCDASQAVKALGRQADLIVCCGGDGTLNETITGVVNGGLKIPIGYIPAGSTNDFANSLGLSGDVVAAAEQIVSGVPRPYDIGKFGDRYFTYVASVGAFTKTSYSTSQSIKNVLGHMAYWLESIPEISKIKKIHLKMEIEGEVIEDDYLFGAICNSTSVGGILTLKSDLVDLGDGKFEILLVRAPKSIMELSECVLALKNQTYDCGMLTFRSAGCVKISADAELPWTLDGEKAEGGDEIIVENVYHGISLVH